MSGIEERLYDVDKKEFHNKYALLNYLSVLQTITVN